MKLPNPAAPSPVDISPEAVARAAADMRTRGIAYRSDRDIADMLEALAAERDRQKRRGDNHAETLRGLSGYTATAESTLKEQMDRAAKAEADRDRLREERRKLFEMISEWMTPLFQLRMQTISVQGRIGGQIHDLRKAWFEEHGYPGGELGTARDGGDPKVERT